MSSSYLSDVLRASELLADAEHIVIGAGSGLSTADGFEYGGQWFQENFADFASAYGFTNAYVAGFYPFQSLTEKWAYWSRFINHNRYLRSPGQVYADLLELVRDKDYFVITTNVDHCFQRAGFSSQRLFYTQGDYGLWQCSVPCSDNVYENEQAVAAMVAEQKDMRIPTELVPHCPNCAAPLDTHLRADHRFVQPDYWQNAAARWRDFASAAANSRTVYLELGVGGNTPGIIKYPFWRAVYNNPLSHLVTVDLNTMVPNEIADRTVALQADIRQVLASLAQNHPRVVPTSSQGFISAKP